MPENRFDHSQLGRFDQWSPESIAQLRGRVGEDRWPALRQGIAGYRSGAGKAPRASDMGPYVAAPDTPAGTEDKRFLAWLLESLMTSGPRPELGMTRKDKGPSGGDIDFGPLPSRAGSGYTG
ncbi:hypothetical protein LCGC14_0345050 [marine sediment metagenome]|uniref:Uncharacterized protein n=1 Tax=marine sediment metagenome TaxID=412755 RepID=A0A0F9TIG2_9ZZZZ